MGRQVAASVLAEPGLTPVGYVDGLAEPGALEGLPLCSDAARACIVMLDALRSTKARHGRHDADLPPLAA